MCSRQSDSQIAKELIFTLIIRLRMGRCNWKGLLVIIFPFLVWCQGWLMLTVQHKIGWPWPTKINRFQIICKAFDSVFNFIHLSGLCLACLCSVHQSSSRSKAKKMMLESEVWTRNDGSQSSIQKEPQQIAQQNKSWRPTWECIQSKLLNSIHWVHQQLLSLMHYPILTPPYVVHSFHGLYLLKGIALKWESEQGSGDQDRKKKSKCYPEPIHVGNWQSTPPHPPLPWSILHQKESQWVCAKILVNCWNLTVS